MPACGSSDAFTGIAARYQDSVDVSDKGPAERATAELVSGTYYSSPGDLESFLRFLIPAVQNPLWQLACDSVAAAVSAGAGCRDAHIGKAQWQAVTPILLASSSKEDRWAAVKSNSAAQYSIACIYSSPKAVAGSAGRD